MLSIKVNKAILEFNSGKREIDLFCKKIFLVLVHDVFGEP